MLKNQINRKRFYYGVLSFLLLVSIPLYAFADDPVDTGLSESDEVIISQQTQQLRISANDTSGLHSIVLSLLGDYNPIATITEYRYPSGTGYQNRYQVDVTPDWSWICTCVLFIVVVYCFFRLIGGIFTGRI